MMSLKSRHFLIFLSHAIAVFGGYAAFFLAFHSIIGDSVAIFAFVPPLIVAWLYGMRRGIIAAVLADILTLVFLQWGHGTNLDASALSQRLPGLIAVVMIAAIVGYMRLLRERMKKELEQRKKSEAELRASEARFKAIYESSNDAVMLLTEKGFFDCNPRTLEMFGFKTREEFSRVHPADISPPHQPDGKESFPAAQERIQTAFQQGSNRFEWVHRRTGGEGFPAEVLLSAFDLNGRRVLQATVRDITERKRIQDQLERKNREILEFTDVITHDLKKPLTAIKTVFSLVNSGAFGKLAGDGPEALETGREAIDYMQELLDDLLACAKLEAGADIIDRQKVQCASIVDQVLDRLKYQIEEKNVAVSTSGFNREVNADPKGFAKILMNLIGNAVNYIGQGPDRRICISAENRDGHVEFTIKDNGLGIPQETQKVLFQKFKRGFNVSGIGGTGLGLSIVKGTVLAHGGKIWFESAEGRGTAFHFTLS